MDFMQTRKKLFVAGQTIFVVAPTKADFRGDEMEFVSEALGYIMTPESPMEKWAEEEEAAWYALMEYERECDFTYEESEDYDRADEYYRKYDMHGWAEIYNGE